MDVKFRNSESIEEIRSIIQRSDPKTTIIWQNTPDGRVVFNCHMIKLDENGQSIRFHLKDYNETLLVDRHIYVKLSYNDSLFKGYVESIEKNVVHINIPIMVKTIDLRQFPREVFLPKDEKKVIIEVAQDIMDDKKQRLTFTTLDLSVNGISIIVSENNLSLVKNFSHHLLVALGDFELQEPILLDLRYDQKFRFRLRGKVIVANRFGFKFLKNLEPALMERFIS